MACLPTASQSIVSKIDAFVASVRHCQKVDKGAIDSSQQLDKKFILTSSIWFLCFKRINLQRKIEYLLNRRELKVGKVTINGWFNFSRKNKFIRMKFSLKWLLMDTLLTYDW